jgi:hypothetical protein
MKINSYETIYNLGKNDELGERKYLAEIRETSPQLPKSKQANKEQTSEQRSNNKYGNYAQRDNPKRGRFIRKLYFDRTDKNTDAKR